MSGSGNRKRSRSSSPSNRPPKKQKMETNADKKPQPPKGKTKGDAKKPVDLQSDKKRDRDDPDDLKDTSPNKKTKTESTSHEEQNRVHNENFSEASQQLKERIERWRERINQREQKKSNATTKREKYSNFLAKELLIFAAKVTEPTPALNALFMLWSHTAPPKIEGKKKSHQGKDLAPSGTTDYDYFRTGSNRQSQLFLDGTKKTFVFDPVAYEFYKKLYGGAKFSLNKYDADTGQPIHDEKHDASNIVMVGKYGGGKNMYSGYGSELNAYSKLKILGKMKKLNEKEVTAAAGKQNGKTGKEYLEAATSQHFKEFIKEQLGNKQSARLDTDHTSQILDHSRNTVEKFRNLKLKKFDIVLLPNKDQKEEQKFFPYPALILEPKGGVKTNNAITPMIAEIVNKFNEKHKVQLYERNSFGFLYPTISNLEKSIRIWPGQVDPALFHELLSEVLKDIDGGMKMEIDGGTEAGNRAYDHTTLLSTLDRSLEFIREIYSRDIEFQPPEVANWFHQRIISNIAKANAIRSDDVKIPDPQDFYLEVTQIIENLNEYGFGLIELQEQWKPTQEDIMDTVRKAYEGSLPKGYKISGAKLTQSGMHAANIALRLRQDNKFVSGPTYFELPQGNKLDSQLNKKQDAKNTLIYDPAYNFTHLADLKTWEKGYVPPASKELKFTTVIADITNVKPNEIASVISQQEDAEKFFLFGSLSKHFQLGMDKFTLGLVLEIEKDNEKKGSKEKKSELSNESFYMPEELLRYFITMQTAQLKNNDKNSKRDIDIEISAGSSGASRGGSIQGAKTDNRQDSDVDQGKTQQQKRFDDFLSDMRKIPQVIDTSESSKKAEPLNLENQYATVAESIKSPKKLKFERNQFKIFPNEGGGDCLFHALEKRNLSMEELLDLREEVSKIKLTMKPTPSINSSNIVAALSQTPGFKTTEILDLIYGRHDVPNEVYAKLQAVPGIYAGEDELQQWCRLKGQTVAVVDSDGTLSIFNKNGTVDRKEYVDENKDTVLKQTLEEADLALFKTSNHWERII